MSLGAKLAIVIACLAIGACYSDTCACVLAPPSGSVGGRVMHASGAPAAQIPVKVSVATSACPATNFTARLLSNDQTLTSEAGEFDLPVMLEFGSPTRVCVRVTVEPLPNQLVATTATLDLNDRQGNRVHLEIQLQD